MIAHIINREIRTGCLEAVSINVFLPGVSKHRINIVVSERPIPCQECLEDFTSVLIGIPDGLTVRPGKINKDGISRRIRSASYVVIEFCIVAIVICTIVALEVLVRHIDVVCETKRQLQLAINRSQKVVVFRTLISVFNHRHWVVIACSGKVFIEWTIFIIYRNGWEIREHLRQHRIAIRNQVCLVERIGNRESKFQFIANRFLFNRQSRNHSLQTTAFKDSFLVKVIHTRTVHSLVGSSSKRNIVILRDSCAALNFILPICAGSEIIFRRKRLSALR